MVRRCSSVAIATILGLLLVALFIELPVAQARKWITGDGRYWKILRACQDGMLVIGTGGGAPPEDHLDLQARAFPLSSSAIIPTSDFYNYLWSPLDDYGPILTQPMTHTIWMSPHSYMILGFIDFEFLTIAWPQLFQPGVDRVLAAFPYLLMGQSSLIEECRVGQFYFVPAPVLPIGENRLFSGTALIAPTELVYNLDLSPSAGSLRLDGAELSLGDRFSQADVNDGLLTYVPEVSDHAGDLIEVSLTGLTRISVSTSGVQGNSSSGSPSISADGTLIAFSSTANNLVSGDTNSLSDVFVRNIPDDRMTRISVSSLGQQANGASFAPDIAPDGNAVAFVSEAENLVGEDQYICEKSPDDNGFRDVYVSLPASRQVYRYSIGADCSQGDGHSSEPALANGGQVAAFSTLATTFYEAEAVALNDIYLHSGTTNGVTEPVSIAWYGGEMGSDPSSAPSISDNGSVIAFESWAANLVPGPQNLIQNVYIQANGETTNLTETANGNSRQPSISAGGRFIAFSSQATNLDANYRELSTMYRIYVHDRFVDPSTWDSQPTKMLPVGLDASGYVVGANGVSSNPVISADGRFVAFESLATNIVPGDTNGVMDVFLVDRDPDLNQLFESDEIRVMRISQALDGMQANGSSLSPAISDDGLYVAFTSFASNLVPDDTNDASDVFLFYTGVAQTFPILILTPMSFLPLIQR